MKAGRIGVALVGLVLIGMSPMAAMGQGLFGDLKKAAEDLAKGVKSAGSELKGAATDIGGVLGVGDTEPSIPEEGGADFVLVEMAPSMREVANTYTIGTIASAEEICTLLTHPVFEAWGTDKWDADRGDAMSRFGFNASDSRIEAAFKGYHTWFDGQLIGVPAGFHGKTDVAAASRAKANKELTDCLQVMYAHNRDLATGVTRILLKSAVHSIEGPCFNTQDENGPPPHECIPNSIAIASKNQFEMDHNMRLMMGVVLREGHEHIKRGLDLTLASLDDQNAERVAAAAAKEAKTDAQIAGEMASIRARRAGDRRKAAEDLIKDLVTLHDGYTYVSMVDEEVRETCRTSNSYVRYLDVTKQKLNPRHQADVAWCSFELNQLRLTPDTALSAMESRTVFGHGWPGMTMSKEWRQYLDDLGENATNRQELREFEALYKDVEVSKTPRVMDGLGVATCGQVISVVVEQYEREAKIIGGRPKEEWCGALKRERDLRDEEIVLSPEFEARVEKSVRTEEPLWRVPGPDQ